MREWKKIPERKTQLLQFAYHDTAKSEENRKKLYAVWFQ